MVSVPQSGSGRTAIQELRSWSLRASPPLSLLGKSTVVKAISGVQTVRFKSELERNITIKLGYANAKIFKCTSPECPRPGCYRAFGSNKEDQPACPREGCTGKMELLRWVLSFSPHLQAVHEGTRL